MNLSGVCKVGVGPTGGETFTVTCYACGMPSSKEWAQRVASRPHHSHHGHQMEPFFPFLSEMSPPPSSVVMEDGSVYLCAFCHALLEAQWNNYEARGDSVSQRKYNVHKFICAVCAVETYRKRVRALPFQEFPFLVKNRQPSSITLGNNPLAVVCLDCSETLWAQSAEYDRWGLPIHKRHFNWMARPPPPEDSVEATVARLPSGETQLPRCPPTDPLVPPRTNEPTALPEAIPPVKSNKHKISGGSHSTTSSSHSSSGGRQHHHHGQDAHLGGRERKSSIGSMSSPGLDLAGGAHTPQPPVVTVAPMSTQNTTTNVRKNSMSSMYPTTIGSSSHQNQQHQKYESMTVTQQPPSAHGGHSHNSSSSGSAATQQLFQQTPLFSPSGSYPSPFPWPGGMSSRDGHSGPEQLNPFGHYGSESLPNPPTWPWLPPASPELLRYQSYINSMQNRRLSEAYYGSSGGGLYGPTATGSFLPPLQLSSGRTPSPPSIQMHLGHSHSASSTTHNLHSLHQQQQQNQSFQEVEEQQSIHLSSRRSVSTSDTDQTEPSQREQSFPTGIEREKSGGSRNAFKKSHHEESSNSNEKKSPSRGGHDSSSPERSQSSKSTKRHFSSAERNEGLPQSSKSKKHLPPPSISKRRSSFSSKSESSSSSSSSKTKRTDVLLPKKRYWQPPSQQQSSSTENLQENSAPPPTTTTAEESSRKLDRKRKFSLNSAVLSDTVPMDFSVSKAQPPIATDSSNCNTNNNSAMDLTTSSSSCSIQRVRTASCPTSSSSSSKFSIAYLSKSESVPTTRPPHKEEEQTEQKSQEEEESQESSTKSRTSVIVSSTSPDKEKEELEEIAEAHDELQEVDEEVACSPKEVVETDQVSPKENEKPEAEGVETDQSVSTEDKPVEKEEKCVSSPEQSQETFIHNMVRVGDLRIEPQDYVRKTIQNYVNEGKEMERTRKQKLNKQLSFLSNLGLITPEKKIEIELETLAGRSLKYTLPPLRMRVKSPDIPKLDEELEEQLMEVAFNDPSLGQGSPEPRKAGFLQNLGLKPSSKNEKSRREVEWRLVLTERLMREKRDEKLRGVKRSWDTYDHVSKLLCLPTRTGRLHANSECLPSLTLTVPAELEMSESPRRNSSDLLTTVEEANQTNKVLSTNSKSEESTTGIKKGVCINYPKYIPSYVLTAQSRQLEEDKLLNATQEDESELNVPSANIGCVIASSTAILCGNEPILRIPVVARRRSSNSTIRTVTTDEEDAAEPCTSLALESSMSRVKDELSGEPPSHKPHYNWSEVDVILKASTAQWLKTKKVMEKVLNETSLVHLKENNLGRLETEAGQLREIRRHLKTQQADMRQTEKLLKGKEKLLLKKLRTLTKYSTTNLVQQNPKENPTKKKNE